jgi:hypothetical protein
MCFLSAPRTKSYQILGRVITQATPWLNVMDLKTLHPSARLATPAISLYGLHGKVGDKSQGQVLIAAAWHGSQSKRYLDVFK